MSLAELTSADAVRRAVEEFDGLGREAFLAKYRFGPAQSYFLTLDGRLYDSKAIVGAAHGFEHPELGPLSSGDFSGGEATVKAKLEGLGFDVVGSGTNRGPDLHLVVKWSQAHGENTVELHREVGDRHGSVWWGLIGKPGTKKIADQTLAALREQLSRATPTSVFISGPRDFPAWRTSLAAIQEERPAERS